jgi:hypothetical protein
VPENVIDENLGTAHRTTTGAGPDAGTQPASAEAAEACGVSVGRAIGRRRRRSVAVAGCQFAGEDYRASIPLARSFARRYYETLPRLDPGQGRGDPDSRRSGKALLDAVCAIPLAVTADEAVMLSDPGSIFGDRDAQEPEGAGHRPGRRFCLG